MCNKNIVTKNIIYGTAGLTSLILAISLGTQTPSNAQIPTKMNGKNSNATIFENKALQSQNYVKLLAQDIKNRLEKAAAILELSGMLPQIKNSSSYNILDQTILQSKGIPQNADIPKRDVAKDILKKYGEFQVVFFLMPNGDIYIEEPYSLQKNLSKTNFAFRDYYKGVITNNDIFLSNIIVSATSGQKQAVIAVPIYSGANGSLTGIWAGGLNMSKFNEGLRSLNLTNNEHMAYVDNLGQVFADSDVNKSKTPESFATLQSFRNAMNGQSGSIVDTVNNTKMLVTYQPIKAFHNTWAVLLMQPLQQQ